MQGCGGAVFARSVALHSTVRPGHRALCSPPIAHRAVPCHDFGPPPTLALPRLLFSDLLFAVSTSLRFLSLRVPFSVPKSPLTLCRSYWKQRRHATYFVPAWPARPISTSLTIDFTIDQKTKQVRQGHASARKGGRHLPRPRRPRRRVDSNENRYYYSSAAQLAGRRQVLGG
jgi:hypothetical protein